MEESFKNENAESAVYLSIAAVHFLVIMNCLKCQSSVL